MKPLATLANGLWLAAGMGARRRFAQALSDPEGAQRELLRHCLALGAGSAYGQQYDFAAIPDAAEFSRRVPLVSYEDVAPWIDRIRRGEERVLSRERVSHLVPTSGTSGARKLIPFTKTLASAFDAAVAPWMADLVRQRPAIRYGPAYWSVSPLVTEAAEDAVSAVPIGFADDAEYLGGAISWLVGQVMAVPASARLVKEPEVFWPLVLLALLRQKELRLISVWHPSFLELLLGAAEQHWGELLEAVATGANPWQQALPEHARGEWRSSRDPRRAGDLRRLGPSGFAAWWPRLAVISCWGDQAAAGGWRRLRDLFPGVLVQAKGLLATEAVITVPIGDVYPLAVTSHYFELLDQNGDLHPAHRLERGKTYEVVVTSGGGLWRYRLGDLVECTGHLAATPTLRFLGRAGVVSDLRGEKLSEPFVAEALRRLWENGSVPELALLAAWDDGNAAGYELHLSTEKPKGSDLLLRLEEALRQNPHYDLARRLGQLEALRLIEVAPEEVQRRLLAAVQDGVRLGEVKPRVLVRRGSGKR